MVQNTLRRQLSWARRRYSLHAQQVEDVEQEAWLELGRRMRSRPDLGLDRGRAATTFPAWLGTVFRNLVKRAVQRKLDRSSHLPLLFDPHTVSATSSPSSMDLTELLERLSAIQQTCVLMFLDGYTLRETAARVGMSYAQTRRHLQQALVLQRYVDI